MKARVKLTGQIIDLIPYEKRTIRCSRQVQLFKTEDGKTFSEFEVEFDKTIDWEQRRYEIAKDVLGAYYAENHVACATRIVVEDVLGITDELIRQLKGGIE